MPNSTCRTLFLAAGLLILMAAADKARAATGDLFGGSLGDWLNTQAIPELTTLLGKHPRFKGERIRVVGMRDGVPASATNELSQQLRSELTHKLTRIKGVQIAWQQPTTGCGLTRREPYLLGVEVVQERRGQALVRVAMVDVEEGVWVSGAHLQWRGDLTSDERRALNQRVVDAPAGTVDAPLDSTNVSDIAARLERHISCALRGGLDGDVFISAVDQQNRFLKRLVAELQQRLVRGAVVGLAEDRDAADWDMQLQISAEVGSSVVASLNAIDQRSAEPGTPSSGGQRLAEVYVQGIGQAGPPVLARLPDAPPSPQPTALPQRLIEGFQAAPAASLASCSPASAGCVEVSFALNAPSYLLVLRTGSRGALRLGSCSAPRKTAGEKLYRLRFADPDNMSGSAFYALATTDFALAEKLRHTLGKASENCGDEGGVRGKAAESSWLNEVEQLLANRPAAFDWQAFIAPGPQETGPGARAIANNYRRIR